MATFLLYQGLPVPARSPVYRQPPVPRPFIRVAYLVDHAPRYSDGSGHYDTCQFYRNTGSTNLILVVGVDRNAAVGFPPLGEPWETASGTFSLPGTRRYPKEKNVCIEKTAQAWTDFQSDTQANLTTAMNAALNQAAYQQEDGSAVT